MFNPSEIRNIAEHEEHHWWYRGMRRISFALLDPLVGSGGAPRVLEGGCGTGHFAAQVVRRYGATVHGIELDAGAARLWRGTPGVFRVRGDVRSIPYPDDSFDLALFLDVLAHLPEGEERVALAEIHRVLRPGGWLFLRTAALGVFRSNHSAFIWEQQRFSRKRLCRVVAEAGFAVERATYSNFFLSPVALLRFRIWEPLMREAPSSGVRKLPAPMEALFYWALRAESRILRLGIDFPFGQSLYLVGRKPLAVKAGAETQTSMLSAIARQTASISASVS